MSHAVVGQPVDQGPALDPSALALLQRYGGPRLKRVTAAIAAGQITAPLAVRAYRRFRHRDEFTVTVSGVDDVYSALHEWVLQRMPDGDRKALIASTFSGHGGSRIGEDDEDADFGVQLRYDGDRKQDVLIDGHKVTVSVVREQIPNMHTSSIPSNWSQYMERVTFTASTAEGRDAIIRTIEKVLTDQRNEVRPPALYMPSRWGSEWVRRGDLPERTIDSVILKEGQLEMLIADLETFLAAEDSYVRLSQPWHRGYLFSGPPGTGKTSIARALANKFGMPTYYLPLGDIKEDTDLMQFVAGISPRSVLLLEDVDAYHTATSREEVRDKASIAAMLNALDGIWTPHGLVTILTTNHREALDEALIRAGRVDVDEEFTVLDDYQAHRLAVFFGERDFDVDPYVGQAPSALIEGLRNGAQKTAVAA